MGESNGGVGVKAARQRRIVRLLEERTVASQNELARLLRAAGYRATQATVSRDLEELGVVKVRRDGQTAYALASTGTPSAGDALSMLLRSSVLGIEASGNLIVVHTPPGHAPMVAGAIDRSALEGVAGTVAGDDTILVVVRESERPRAIEQELRSLAGMPERLASRATAPEVLGPDQGAGANPQASTGQHAIPERAQEEAEAER